MKIGSSWLFDARIKLRHNAEKFFRTFKRIKKRERTLAPNRQRHHRAWKKNRVSHGQDR